MATPKIWTFEQLGGDRKVMYLSGWSAPFGRPRLGAIVNAGTTIRRTVTLYPGNRVAPTVHSFGEIGKPFDIHGRWMDAAIGTAGAARELQRDWDDFVADQQEVRARWGDILSYRIFIYDVDIEYESEAQVAWRMQADRLVDEAAPVVTRDDPVRTPVDLAVQMSVLLIGAQRIPNDSGLTNLLDILPEIADLFESLQRSLNAPFAVVYDVASQLADFETALSSDLRKMGSGLQAMKTGILQLRQANDLAWSRASFLNAPGAEILSGNVTGIFDGPTMSRLCADKTEADVASTTLLALIADMQNEIDRRTRGQAGSAHAAQDGDTWESLSTRLYGSPDNADALRAMNGVKYGSKPQPGKVYTVPKV